MNPRTFSLLRRTSFLPAVSPHIQPRLFSTSTVFLNSPTVALPAQKPVGAFRGGWVRLCFQVSYGFRSVTWLIDDGDLQINRLPLRIHRGRSVRILLHPPGIQSVERDVDGWHLRTLLYLKRTRKQSIQLLLFFSSCPSRASFGESHLSDCGAGCLPRLPFLRSFQVLFWGTHFLLFYRVRKGWQIYSRPLWGMFDNTESRPCKQRHSVLTRTSRSWRQDWMNCRRKSNKILGGRW